MPDASIAIAAGSYAGSINIGASPWEQMITHSVRSYSQSHEIQRPKRCERFRSVRLKAGSQPIGGRDSVVTTGDGTVEVFLGASCR